VPTLSRDDGFSLAELMISTTIMLLIVSAALTTFKNALDINDAAGQVADSSQNLRAGTNQLVRDLMMAGRVIAGAGVPVPNGSGATAIARPGPPGSSLTFDFVADDDGTLNLPSIATGYQLGPTISGNVTDIVTILTVDGFMPVIQGIGSGTPTAVQGVIAPDGSSITLPSASAWLVSDPTERNTPVVVGDLVLFKNVNGMAVQTITSKDTTHIYFAQNHVDDWFHFNQRSAALKGTVYCIKNGSDPTDLTKRACDPASMPVTSAILAANFPATSLLRLLMITYYVDNTTYVDNSTTPAGKIPRMTRVLNHFTAQALAGVVENLQLTYDLVDPTLTSVANKTSLPYTDPLTGMVYSSAMIGKVNLIVGVRSETVAKASRAYLRNQILTSVAVRSLASVDRYDTSH
jgi:prepilin-type N-terminal cleavage/methylation domain-containing protein